MQNAVYIISVAPYAVAAANRPYGNYLVPAAPKNGFTRYRVTDVKDYFDMGDKRYIPLAIQARALAEDLIKDVREHGLFISDDGEPTPQELEAANQARMAYLQKQIDNADAEYRQHGNRGLISDHAKAAAEILGVKKEWSAPATDLVACPNCEARISPIVAQCPHCRATINAEKAREYLLLTPEQEKNLIAMGKLKPLFSDAIGETGEKQPVKVATQKKG